jgi:ABC-type uncharacterized transport system involved in gliding motility auxiliary subunit
MNTKQSKLLQQVINGVLVVIVVGLLGFLSSRYKAEFDWTAGNRNTLTEGSRRLLGALKDPVKFTAFVYADMDKRDYQQWFDRYKRFKKDIDAQFIDPSRDPQKVKEYNISSPGEVVIEYQGRRESVSHLDERNITGALQRLSDSGEHYIVFLEGHGERSINTAGNTADAPGGGNQNDYDQFAQALRDKGLKVQGLNLTKTPRIPDNTSVLVIAGPAHKLLDGEEKIVQDYLQHGGDLLWLADPEEPVNEGLAKSLGVTWLNGFAVFANYQLLGTGNPAIYLATDYPPNPVTRDLDAVTAFPLVRPLRTEAAGDWQAQPLLQTDDKSWLETGGMQGEISFDEKSGDVRGPLTIGVTLTREIKNAAPAADTAGKPEADKKDSGKDVSKDAGDKTEAAKADEGIKPRTQRVVLIGDSDFLSDANLDALGNKQLGLNLVQWLAARDAQLNIDVPKAPDTQLYLPGWAKWLIGFGYVLMLPVLLLGYGVTRWAIRRRA